MAKETEKQKIARLKEEYLRFFSDLPVQKAAADFIGRDVTTIQGWARDDDEFKANVSRAKAEWAKKNHRRIKPDNLLARLYDDLKPVPQEVDANVTHDVRNPDALQRLAESSGFVPATGQSDTGKE